MSSRSCPTSSISFTTPDSPPRTSPPCSPIGMMRPKPTSPTPPRLSCTVSPHRYPLTRLTHRTANYRLQTTDYQLPGRRHATDPVDRPGRRAHRRRRREHPERPCCHATQVGG